MSLRDRCGRRRKEARQADMRDEKTTDDLIDEIFAENFGDNEQTAKLARDVFGEPCALHTHADGFEVDSGNPDGHRISWGPGTAN